jgi:hypothetical protein
MINKHIFYDRLTATLGSVASGKKKFFANTIDSQDFETHIRASDIEVKDLEPGLHEFRIDSLEGPLDAAFLVHQFNKSRLPTIIYHHGNNERPFDFSKKSLNTFKSIFVDSPQAISANIIAIRAPFHDLTLQEYHENISDLSKFMAMLSVSVSLVEALVFTLHGLNSTPVVVSGISLGGWVTNLHRTFFNSADLYVPLLAGAALDDLFIHSRYCKMAGSLARENPDKIVRALNFEDRFQSVTERNVLPLLARYDQFIRCDRQQKSYSDHPIKVIDKGHITAALSSRDLRDHILSSMRRYIVSSRMQG